MVPRDFPLRLHRLYFGLWCLLVVAALSVPSSLCAQDGLLPSAPADTEETATPLSAVTDERQDEDMAQGLQRRFHQIDGLTEVQVDVEAGVITLSGRVLQESDRDAALAMARRVDNVAHVNNQIEVEVNPVERLAPTLSQGFQRLRTLISYLPLLAVGLVVLLFFYWLSRRVGQMNFLFSHLSHNKFAQDLLKRSLGVIVLLAGILLTLELLDATALVGAVLGTAGVVGLAVGFAFRDLVENYIASILLSLRQPFAPKDHVSIDGREGKVIRLTSRATILMTMDGNHLRIPNSQVFKGIILNYTRNPKRRFDFGVGVGVGEDLGLARSLGIEAMQKMPGILSEPLPSALIEELGDSNVLVRFFGWVDQTQAEFCKVKSEAIRQVKTVLEEAGMDLPEPIYRVHMVEAPPKPEASSLPDTSVTVTAAATSQEDIAPDDHIERQIGQERAQAGEEEDLLDAQAPTE